jgi:hypothetical protein
MPRVLIGFVDRIVRVFGHCFRIAPQGPPKVRYKAIEVVDSFSGGRVWAIQEHRAGAKERLDIILDVAEPFPNKIGDCGLSTKPREGRFHAGAYTGSIMITHPGRSSTPAGGSIMERSWNGYRFCAVRLTTRASSSHTPASVKASSVDRTSFDRSGFVCG